MGTVIFYKLSTQVRIRPASVQFERKKSNKNCHFYNRMGTPHPYLECFLKKRQQLNEKGSQLKEVDC